MQKYGTDENMIPKSMQNLHTVETEKFDSINFKNTK